MTQATETAGAPSALPLTGVRVVDMSDGKGEMCGRLLADLGADVVLVEPPGGGQARRTQPLVDGTSVHFAAHHANKRGVVLDVTTPADRQLLLALVDTADLLIETGRPGALAELGLDPVSLLMRRPELVVVSITDFGQTGPYRDWVATDAVHVAMGGLLCRSGIPGEPPLLPPTALAAEVSAVQAAWAALLAYWNRLDTGFGDHVDLSVHEATAQVLDPGFGVTGTAARGRSAYDVPRGRPEARHYYPIFRCADGHVRICILAPRQWHGMRAWLGDPKEFADPRYDSIATRFAEADALHALIAELFAQQPASLLVEEGQRRGVPIAKLQQAADVLHNEHYLARGALADVEIAPGMAGRMPTGFLEINGRRAGFRVRAPKLGEHQAEVFADVAKAAPAPAPRAGGAGLPEPRRPLAGLRVLDLGVIVVGAELGRLFADQGADVIKVENASFPDGGRQSLGGEAVSASFAQGHRGKTSLGLNLRLPEGRALFEQLVAQSDVVLSNFKPGTLESLGLGYNDLRRINPSIVVADSSAFGNTGPWSRRMGYGPLVRASTALTNLWSDPEVDGSFSDAITIFPDHFAARVGAVGVLATLLARRTSDQGGTVSVSQAETILTALSHRFLQESLQPGSFVATGNSRPGDAPRGVFPCAGDDEWCVVEVRDDDDWRRLCGALGRPELTSDPRFATASAREQSREFTDELVRNFTSRYSPREVSARLQAHGVPAGFMQRLDEYADDPHFAARGLLQVMHQPGLPEPLLTENAPARTRGLADPDVRPAPFLGEHTRSTCHRLLGLDDTEIDALLAAGVLDEWRAPVSA